VKTNVRQAEIAVLGAGPAGIAAALAASQAGAAVTLVDEYPRPGGQIYRQPPDSFCVRRPEALGKEYRAAQRLLGKLGGSPVTLLTGTLVWGVERDRTLFMCDDRGGGFALKAEAIIIAAGAYDRPMAFPGWTLPGVWTAGGAQAMLKSQRIVPGRRILVAGAGPLLLPVATALAAAGATVVGVVEATTRWEWARQAHRMLGHWDRIVDFLRYEAALLRARVPRFFGHAVIRAEGRDGVERATIAAIDRHWRVTPGTEQAVGVDLVCIGYGFLSSVELPRLLECEMDFHPLQEQYLPRHTGEMATSVPGVFVAGETTGIGGAKLAQAEGEIAGLAAARLLGHALGDEHRRALAAAQSRRRHELGFARLLDLLFATRPGIYQLAQPETPLCRCEEVTVAEVRDAVRRGARSVRAVKAATRVGMGPCQGRICGNLVGHLVAQETGRPLHEVLDLSPRPPVKPVPLAVLAELLEIGAPGDLSGTAGGGAEVA
jgi:thioredoxin reductase/bacterioferritin-associated ferredoxin